MKPDSVEDKSSVVIEEVSSKVVEETTSVALTEKLVPEIEDKSDRTADKEKPSMSAETKAVTEIVQEKSQTTKLEPKGSLKLIIHNAASLGNKDMIGKSDPYAVIEYGKQKSKSKTIKSNLNPVWEHEAILDLDKEKADVITITVYDEDYGKDDVMGIFELPVKEALCMKSLHQQEYSLKNCKSGKISVSYDIVSDNKSTIAESEKPAPAEEQSALVVENKYTPAEEKSSMAAEMKPDSVEDKSSVVIEEVSSKVVEETTSVALTEKLVPEIEDKSDRTADKEKPSMSAETKAVTKIVQEKSQTTKLEPKGSLKLIIHNATSLGNKDMIGKSDPYVVIEYGKQTSKSKTIKSNLNPVWEHEAILDLDKEKADVITITVYDDDYGKDDVMGTFELPVQEALGMKSLHQQEYCLKNCKSGKISVSYNIVDEKVGKP